MPDKIIKGDFQIRVKVGENFRCSPQCNYYYHHSQYDECECMFFDKPLAKAHENGYYRLEVCLKRFQEDEEAPKRTRKR